MKFRTLGRHIKEGFKSLGRNGWMSFASISAVTVTLLLVGVFLVLLLNINAIASQIEDDVEIRVYLEKTSEEPQHQELQQQLEGIEEVSSVKYVPKEEGLQELIDSLGDEGKVFQSLEDENPLPDAFAVKTERPQDTPLVADEIETLDYVSEVRYGQGTVERLFKITDTARNVGLVLIVGLLFTAMFLIANTIKITIVSRGTEIEIMKLVGATNGFIRWPFFVEGILLGVLGSLIPIGILIFAYQFIYEAVSMNLNTILFQLLPVYPLMFQLAGLLVIIGAFIGVWGSMTSVRKFLKV
ncbi:permease-like cell division protein FtsX [Pseudalkalibacillus decolorationis]|uniref:permease-like cell division protein FtsX n=1 Tax=Pseudalkalibacillus decolorationis TaxID=163879 RepID=UPI0021492EC5|nr:permease-like cell division protein FtsX [Pseudalkalibacillus decolorationis]